METNFLKTQQQSYSGGGSKSSKVGPSQNVVLCSSERKNDG